MKTILATVVLSLAFSPLAFAKEGEKKAQSPAQKAQQMRMKECSASAKGMKGDERKKHMKECLSKKK